MLNYILCFFGGALVGVALMCLVSGNRPDDEYTDGFHDGYAKATEKYSKLP